MSKARTRILVIQLRQIGDILLTTPAVEVLRRNFPDAQIDFLAEKPGNEILNGNPFVDKVIVYDRKHPVRELMKIRSQKYDMVIDFLSNPRSALITFLSGAQIKAGPDYTFSRKAYNLFLKDTGENKYNAFFKIDLLKSLGLDDIFYPYPKFFFSGEDAVHALSVTRKKGIPDNAFIIGFAPTSRRITRKWPERHYAELADLIRRKYPEMHIMVFWGPGEYETAKEIKAAAESENLHLAPRISSLHRLGATLKRCKLLISNCNGSKHIAQAAGIPTLGIYSSSDPEAWNPPNDPRHRSVRLESLECIGCGKNKCPKNMECLRELKPEYVFSKFEEMLSNIPLYEPAETAK